MLGTLIKALEIDFRNVEDERYLRSAAHVSQNLSRILAIRKHYPEFKAKKPAMFPKLMELCKLSKKEGLCLTYWHDCSEACAFTAVLGNKTAADETALLASRPSRFKTASLSRFMQRGEDKVLLSYLTDVSKTKGANIPKRVFNTQAHRQQVTGLLYHLHVLEEQLQTMVKKRRHQMQKLDFTPETNFAPAHYAPANFAPAEFAPINFAPNPSSNTNFVAKDFVVPISFDNEQAPIASSTPHAPDAPSAHQPNRLSKQSYDSHGPVDIWYSLAEDMKTPYRFLVWLSENPNPYISQRALATLQRQKDAQQIVYPVSYQTAPPAAFAS
ncbi:MAG: hypothetical protein JST89_10750 [Cyanobacteria bacterium SZAS-4]|nr:hypothetical protein [Cyanobacteria bacterium SZAS-4]